MWSFVRKRENEIWIWLALEVNSRKINAVGDRSVYTFKKLWGKISDKIKRKAVFYTDRWDAYNLILKQRIIKRKGTNHIEQLSLTLRNEIH